MGVQRTVSDTLDVRFGYVFNQNPMPESQAMLAVGAPLYYQHQVSTGATIRLTEELSASVAYAYAIENSMKGPLVTPAGPVPGSNLKTSESVHLISVGLNVAY